MVTRGQALSLIGEHVANKNIIKHMIALEAFMGGVYDELKTHDRTDKELGGNKEEWLMAGLLHDGDYNESVPREKQGIQITQWAKEKGYAVPENVAYAMAAHNWGGTGVEPKNLMDWTIFMGDSLTGLIVAATLVLPSKKLADVTPQTVLNRFKEKAFAKGTRREDIALCESKLGIPLKEFIEIGLEAMKGINEELGL